MDTGSGKRVKLFEIGTVTSKDDSLFIKVMDSSIPNVSAQAKIQIQVTCKN